MDKIWDRNPSKSKVIGHGNGDKKNTWMITQNGLKSNAKNKPKNTLILHAKFVNDQKSINLSPP